MAKAQEPKHIFVINDEATLRSPLRELLEEEGYRATLDTFDPGGVEGQLARVRQLKPDLVVLDFLIGGEPLGWQFLQALRLQRETEKLPVVVCTAAAHTVKDASRLRMRCASAWCSSRSASTSSSPKSGAASRRRRTTPNAGQAVVTVRRDVTGPPRPRSGDRTTWR